MITQNVDSFILGVDRYPEWFKNFNVTYTTAESGLLVSVSIETRQGTVKANRGDVIMMLQGVLYAIPQEAAKRFMKI